MNESSDKESAFGLSADQIGRLLSIGSGKDPIPAEPPSSTDASGDKPALSAVEGSESSLQIDGYEIIEKVAEAGQGQVWRALQQSTGRDVAIKVPKLGSVTSERARVRFEREVELAARLKHPNIARIYDSGVDRGQYYYVMDFVEGLNLNDYVMKHDLTHRQIFELMKTICQAVQHAHQNGVIHRDLKPSNIIVTDDGRPFIVDFGLAKGLLEDDRNLVVSMDGETVGTPAYMSPEQAAGHTDKVDTRTDVYSLGVTLFTLLTGSNPHDLSGSRLEVIHRIADEEVRRPRSLNRNIDKDIEALLLKALDRDPDRRYSSAAGLTEDIDNYLKGEPLIAGSQSNVYRLKKFVKRNWLLVTSIAAVLAVLVAGIIVSTLFAIKAQREAKVSQSMTDFFQSGAIGGIIGTNDQFVVLNVPDESPGDPSYADIGRYSIPADGTQVAIVFMRDPAYIPPEFNLLDMRDIPAAFECPFLLRGQDWFHKTIWLNFLRTRSTSEKPDRHEPFVDFPIKSVYVLENDGSVPVYFVDLAELDSEIADDQLTLGELEAFSSLKVGQATYVKEDILNSNAPDSDGKGHGRVTAIGTLQESGEFFYVHWHEEFDPAIGKNVFRDLVIKFFPGAN